MAVAALGLGGFMFFKFGYKKDNLHQNRSCPAGKGPVKSEKIMPGRII